MSSLFRLANRSFRGPPPPSLEDFEALLDLLPSASVLVDLERRQIHLTNARTTELTAYTRAELAGRAVDQLLPDYPLDRLTSDSQWHRSVHFGVLAVRSGGTTEVEVHAARLDPHGRWAVLTFESLALQKQLQDQLDRQFAWGEALHAIVQTLQMEDLDRALHDLLRAGQGLTGCRHLWLYQIHVDERTPQLRLREASRSPGPLPTTLSPPEMGALQRPYLWTPRQHTAHELHRRARTSGLQFLATVPLGSPGAVLGLLVVGDKEREAPEDLLLLTESLAGVANTILQHHTLTRNLRTDLAATRSRNAIHELILEGIQDGVILLSPELTVQDMNPFAELTLGYALAQVQGKPISDILVGSSRLATALELASQGIPSDGLGNLKLHRRSGHDFPAHVRILPLQREERIENVIILLQDLSEKEALRVRTQQLEHRALLGEISAIFSHEVINPINNLSSGLQLLAHTLPDDDRNQERIRRLMQDLKRLEHRVRAVLDFSRTTEHQRIPVDLDALVRQLLERWGPHANRYGIETNHHAEPGTPHVVGDPDALEQVFTNLISNSVQAMEDTGGALAVKIRPVTGQNGRAMVEAIVSDNGPGIPEEIRDRIFDPFFTTNEEGTGLGLAITRRIVSAHHGSIHLESFPGGTIFRILLPAVE